MDSKLELYAHTSVRTRSGSNHIEVSLLTLSKLGQQFRSSFRLALGQNATPIPDYCAWRWSASIVRREFRRLRNWIWQFVCSGKPLGILPMKSGSENNWTFYTTASVLTFDFDLSAPIRRQGVKYFIFAGNEVCVETEQRKEKKRRMVPVEHVLFIGHQSIDHNKRNKRRPVSSRWVVQTGLIWG